MFLTQPSFQLGPNSIFIFQDLPLNSRRLSFTNHRITRYTISTSLNDVFMMPTNVFINNVANMSTQGRKYKKVRQNIS